jgi:PilZ domain-containing protein
VGDGKQMTMLKFKPRAKPENRRRSERHAVGGLAKIRTGAGSLPRDCWVSDISDGGVRLHAEGLDVPDEFTLVLVGVEGGRRDCRVAWRLGHEVGAEFIDQPQSGFAHKMAGRR